MLSSKASHASRPARVPGPSRPPRARSGRRAGPTGTRAAILASARKLFAGKGFDGATLRAVARAARVDPALVVHFFGSKEELFAQSLELPYSPEEIREKLAGPPATLGRRVAGFYLRTLFQEKSATVLSLLRSSVTNPRAAALLRRTLEAFAAAVFLPLLPRKDALLRGELAASHMLGLFLARRVLGVEPLASEDDERLVEAVAPALQLYLTGPLPGRRR